MLQKCGLNSSVYEWQRVLTWAIQKFKGKALISVILRLAWRATVYCIWLERNARVYQGSSKTLQQILAEIQDGVKFKLTQLKNVADDINRLLSTNWDLNFY